MAISAPGPDVIWREEVVTNKGEVLTKYIAEKRALLDKYFNRAEGAPSQPGFYQRYQAAVRELAFTYVDKYPFLTDPDCSGAGLPAADTKAGISKE